ncbi:hypothetical protein DIPPA_21034 [Diplonema papillatum]|nr:hypothetical protein DIPPA_21034 [Diplonema papillatum]
MNAFTEVVRWFFGLFIVVAGIVMTIVRKFLDSWLIAKGVRLWWLTDNVAGDGKPTAEGVEVVRDRYGEGWREEAHWLRPPGAVEGAKGIVLSLHGGGWACANAHVVMHSMTPYVREGYTVYVPNYPLAPKKRFPEAIVALLRAMRHLHELHAASAIHIIGDSAGGNLATMLAAMCSNPSMYASISSLARSVSPGVDIPGFDSLPTVASVTSIYGILDQSSHNHPIPFVSSLETRFTSFLYDICIAIYSRAAEPKVTLADWVDDLDAMPPTHLICGMRDPLVHSHSRMHWILKQKGIASSLHLVPGARHAFFGVPQLFFSGLAEAQRVVVSNSLAFLRSVEAKRLRTLKAAPVA